MKIKTLVDLLHKANGSCLTSAQITQAMPICSRTVIRYVKKAQEIGEQNGFEIVSTSGKGYQLVVTDQQRFDTWYSTYETAFTESIVAVQVARYLLNHDTCKLDELADSFHYSRSSMSRAISEVASLIEPFGLRLSSRAYVGLLVEGGEISVRNCLLSLHSSHEDRVFVGKQAQSIMAECVKKHTHGRKFDVESALFQYFSIAHKRVSSHHRIDAEAVSILEKRPFLAKNQLIVESFLARVAPESKLLQSPADLEYLSWLLARYLPNDCAELKYDGHISSLAEKIVRDALERVGINCQMSFQENEKLLHEISLHISENFGSYFFGFYTENIYTKEIKHTHPSAYYVALEIASCISEHTKRNVTPEEIAYLAMFIAAAQEKKDIPKPWTSKILYEGSRGPAVLLAKRLQCQYENICVAGFTTGVQGEEDAAADFYLSTKPAPQDMLCGKPVLTVSPFLNDSDRQKLDSLLNSLEHGMSFRHVSSARLFFLLEKEKRKKKVLEYLAEALKEQGLLTAHEIQILYERETMVSSEIAPGVAFPHCMVQGGSFLAFARLLTPVPWGHTDAELVIFCGLHKGDGSMRAMLEKIFKFVQDETRLAQALRCDDYESLMKCFD